MLVQATEVYSLPTELGKNNANLITDGTEEYSTADDVMTFCLDLMNETVLKSFNLCHVLYYVIQHVLHVV